MADGQVKVELELENKKAKSEATKAGKEIGEAVKSGAKSGGSALDGLKSKFGSTFKSAGSSAKDAMKGVSDSAKSMVSDVAGAGEKGGSALGALASKAAGVVAALGGIAAATNLIKASLDAYANYEQLIGGVETLFGAGGKSVEEYAQSVGKSVDEVQDKYAQLSEAENLVKENAKNAWKDAGVSANTYMEQATSFSASLINSLEGDTVKAAEYANTAIVDMSDNANKMGTDIGMIQNAYQGFAKQNYTMLDNLKLGYGGTKTEMERLIADANKLKEAQGEAADLTIDSYADVIEAIHLVQDNMGITGTTALEAATTIEGSMGMVKASYEDFLVSLGTGEVAEPFTNLVEAVSTAAPLIIDRITEIALSLSRVMLNLLPDAVGKLAPMISELLAGLVTAIVNLIPALISAGAQLIGGLLTGILQALPEVLTTITESLIESIPTMIETITSVVTALVEALPGIIQALVDALPGIIDNIVLAITDSVDVLVDGFIQLFQAVVTALPQIIQALIDALPTIIDAIVNGLISSATALVDGFVQLFMAIVEALPQIISAIVPMIPQIITALTTALLGRIDDLVMAAVQLFMAFIMALPQIIAEIVPMIPQIIMAIVSLVIQSIPMLLSAAVQLFMGFIAGIVQSIPQIISTVAQVGPQILAKIGEIPGKMIEAGKSIIDGLWNGISGAIGGFLANVGNFCSNVMSTITGFFGIHSPSTLMRDMVGANLARGISVGFIENDPAETMTETLEDSVDSLEQTAQGLAIDIPVNEEETQDVGAETVSAYTESINDQADEANDSGTLMSSEVTAGMGEGVSVADKIGVNTAESYIGEINRADAKPAAAKLKDGAITELNKGEEEAYKSGVNLAQGFINGMDSMLNAVIQKAAQLAREAVEAIKREGKEGSPWKTTIQSGKFAAEGLVVGFEQENPMAQIADVVRSGMSALSMLTQSGGIGGNYTTNNQTLNFNQPIASPDQIARTMRMQQNYGLAGSY